MGDFEKGLIAFGFVALVFFVGWWTYAHNDNLHRCYDADRFSCGRSYSLSPSAR